MVGEIDTLTAPELATFLTVQLIEAPLVVVNLDGVRFLSSAGLRALFEAHEFALREDRDLWLVCHSQTVNWALEITGLREHFLHRQRARGARTVGQLMPAAAGRADSLHHRPLGADGLDH